MTLDGPIKEVEAARKGLTAAARASSGWSGDQRARFDRNRMKPLDDAGAQLAEALLRARQQCAAAERLLAER